MASKSEVGIVKNVANFDVFVTEIRTMGTLYNPANPGIKLVALEAKQTACGDIMAAVRDATVPAKIAINAREAEFNGIKKKGTRVVNMLAGSGAAPEIIKDAKGYLNKLRGTRTTKLNEPTPENPVVKNISTSQLSYDNLIANFEMITALVKGEPKYTPNETELTVVELEKYVANLKKLTKDVNDTVTVLGQLEIDRDEEIYGPVTGLSELTGTIKSYVKGVLGANDPLYRRLTAIKFTRKKISR
jgi:hypothetical protein